MNTSGILGFACGVLLLSAFVALGGAYAVFLNVPALCVCAGIPFALTLATRGLREYIRLGVVLRALFVNLRADDVRASDAAAAHRLVIHTYAAGVISVLLGLCHMCASFDDPSRIGAGMAVSFLGPLYTLLLAELWFRPCLRRIEKLVAAGAASPHVPALCSASMAADLAGPFATLTLVLFVILEFCILMLSFATIAPAE